MKKTHIYTTILCLGLIITSYAQSVVANKNATVVGWFAGNPPKLDGKLNDAIWTTPYSNVVTTGQGTSGAGFANGHFPNRIDNQININDNGVVAPTSPAGAPSSSLYNTTASFGVCWDDTKLYIGIVVYDPNFSATQPNISANVGSQIYFAMDPGAVSAKPSTAAVWPPVLNAGWEGQLQLNYRGASVNKLTQANTGWVPAQGMQILDSDGEAYTAPTTHPVTGQGGYIIETAISWAKLNSQWISPATGLYTDNTKIPLANRVFKFDVSNEIYNSALTTRVAELMWNMCCYNDNYQEAKNYGTIILSGLNQVVCPTSLSNTCSGCSITVPNGLRDISELTPTPGTATTGVVWSIINPNTTAGLSAKVSSNGIVTALNNGIVTVIGTSNCTTPSAPIPTKVTSIITISNQTNPTSLAINTTFTGSLTGMWAYVPFTATVSPGGASQDVVWSVASPAGGLALATINSITGVLRSTSVGNGVVTITATSIANKNVFNTRTLAIQPRTTLQNCNWYIGSYTNDAKCRTFRNTTFAGYTSNIAVYCLYQHPDYSNTLLQQIPSELISYSVRKVVNVVATTVGASGDLQLSNVQASGVFTITGTYNNDPSISSVVVVRLNSAATQLLTSTGCNNPIANGAPCVGVVTPTGIVISGSTNIQNSGSYSYSIITSPVGAGSAVYWYLSDYSKGSISSNGVFTPTSATGSVIIYATSQLDNSVTAQLTVNISQSTIPQSIAISGPSSVAILSSYQYIINASPSGSDGTVTWSLSDNSKGTISGSGLFSPSQLGNVNIIATSSINNSLVAMFPVTIFSNVPFSININGPLSIAKGTTQQYSISTNPSVSSNAVNWSVNNSTFASINSQGLLTAINQGVVTITANSILNNAISTSIAVSITGTTTSTTTSNSMKVTGVTVTVANNNAIITWNNITGVNSYCLQISSDPNFSSINTINPCGVNATAYIFNNQNSTSIYYVKVAGEISSGSTYPYSDISIFNFTNTSNTPGLENIDIVYPIPVKDGKLYIKTNQFPTKGTLYSSKGDIVNEVLLKENTNNVDVSNLAKGLYFLIIESKKHTVVIE
ncbi:MAG: Ig-like domain-containing protein [Bacteroidota bacterium]|nr:Ig-like domain-containing protein [Bacteroidota bacterium]